MRISAACVLLVATGLVLSVACADETPSLSVSQGCSLSSECKSPLVCAFAKCHQACKSSRDCQNGERCVQSDRPYYVCQKQGCTRNSDCLGKQVCAQDGQCHDECLTQKDCLADQVCTTGACADTSELVNGTLPNVLSDAGGVGQRCTLPTGCPGDLVCLRGGVCGAECIGDKDCRKTYVCRPLHEGGPGRCFPEDGLGDAGPDAASRDAGSEASTDAAISNDGGDGGLADLSLAAFGHFANGGNSACVVLTGKVKCWGQNTNGQLGLGDSQNRGDGPNEMGDKLPFVDLGTGVTATGVFTNGSMFCAIASTGRVKCWGQNSFGQLGYGDTQDRGNGANQMGDNLPFVDLGTGRTAKALAGATPMMCAILDNDKVKCWGYNGSGQLGLGDTQARGDGAGEMGDNLPFVNLGTGRTAKAITSGGNQICVLLDNNQVKCWGANSFGQLGYGDTTPRGASANDMGDNLPFVSLGTGRSAKSIAAGALHTCAILDNDTLKCWGYAGAGDLGLGDTQNRGDGPNEMGDNLPVVNLGPGRIAKSITAGLDNTCVVLDDATLKCWGSNADGQLGYGDLNSRGGGPNQMGSNLPAVNLGTGRTVVAVIKHFYGATCAVLDDGKVKCWGDNTYGQLGLGDVLTRGNAANQMGDNLPYVKLVGP